MTLFTILICFILQRYFHLQPTRSHVWLDSYIHQAQNSLTWLKIIHPWAVVILLTLLIGLVTGGLDALLKGVWFNSLHFLFNILVLFFCLDTRSLRPELTHYFATCQKDEPQAAYLSGCEFLKLPQDQTPTDLVTLASTITRHIFLHAAYLFSVLFWYILAGPMGAAVYAFVTHLIKISQQSPTSEVAKQLHDILDWIPVRITALTYALMGHFAFALNYLASHLFSGLEQTQELAIDAGLAALETGPNDLVLSTGAENQAALDLVDRTTVLWLVVIALFTLSAWIS